MFATLSDRLDTVFTNLRGKGRLSEADIDATAREIRIALLEADVALPVVREFVAAVKERARGAEVSQALNPAQQVIKIVNEELVEILGGETRRLRSPRQPPTVIMLAGLQGAGKTTLAGKLALLAQGAGHAAAARRRRPAAPQRRQPAQVVGERAGVDGLRARARQRRRRPGRRSPATRSSTPAARMHDVVIVDTAGRLGIDAELMQQAADIRDAVQPDEILFVVDAMIGQDAVTTAQAFLDGVGFDGVVLTKLDGDARGGAALSVAARHRPADHVRLHRREARRLRRLPPRPDGLAHPRHGRRAHPDRAGREDLRRRPGRARWPPSSPRGEDFTLDDFLEQMQAIRKMGSISNARACCPGWGR